MKARGSRITQAGWITGAMLGALGLASCESSTRLGSLLPGSGGGASPPIASRNLPPPPPLTAAPADEVESSTLPPLAGTAPPIAATPYPGTGAPQAPALGNPTSSVGTAPGNLPRSLPGSETPGGQSPPDLRNTSPALANASPAPPSRTSLTGNWSLAEAAGNRCRITLSSASKLDLYAAATNGCQSKELQRVNAWELNGSEVILYEPGGTVTARLRSAGGNAYSGVVTKSGAPISLSK